MTKSRPSEILADENRKRFRKKMKLGKFSTESEKFSESAGTPETEGKCIIASGGWTPLDGGMKLIICRCTIISYKLTG